MLLIALEIALNSEQAHKIALNLERVNKVVGALVEWVALNLILSSLRNILLRCENFFDKVEWAFSFNWFLLETLTGNQKLMLRVVIALNHLLHHAAHQSSSHGMQRYISAVESTSLPSVKSINHGDERPPGRVECSVPKRGGVKNGCKGIFIALQKINYVGCSCC